jgi:hypothetical protein
MTPSSRRGKKGEYVKISFTGTLWQIRQLVFGNPVELHTGVQASETTEYTVPFSAPKLDGFVAPAVFSMDKKGDFIEVNQVTSKRIIFEK